MPTKTGANLRIIVLGSGPDADEARKIADTNDNVSIAAKFTKTVTHLVVDDTVKPSEARVKKAEETGVPVLSLDALKILLASDGSASEGSEEDVPESVEEPAAEVESEAVVEPAVDVVPEPESEESTPEEVEEQVSEVEEAASEPEPEPEPEVEEPAAEAEPSVPAQAEAPAVETDADEQSEAEAEAEEKAPAAKPGLFAKIKSIFGMSGAK